MAFLENELIIKESNITGAGNGLFTTQPIAKGTIILEYTGTITSWKNADRSGNNPYLFFVNHKHVIDAVNHADVLGRYVNDAKGLSRIKGFKNNAQYVKEKGKIYLAAICNIPAGEEILAHYGREYWDAIKHNMELLNS
ncbi:MAG: SET domain-containing protein-lysine N-methyltransferase [Chitinophagaceae bacterium]